MNKTTCCPYVVGWGRGGDVEVVQLGVHGKEKVGTSLDLSNQGYAIPCVKIREVSSE